MLFSWPQRAIAELQTAVFAGGCFWCLEHDLEDLPGVRDAVSGYSGGQVERPTYRQVSSETTGHQEAVQVRFDPDQISYAELLRITDLIRMRLLRPVRRRRPASSDNQGLP